MTKLRNTCNDFLRDSGKESQTVGPKTENKSLSKGLMREARNSQQRGVKRAQYIQTLSARLLMLLMLLLPFFSFLLFFSSSSSSSSFSSSFLFFFFLLLFLLMFVVCLFRSLGFYEGEEGRGGQCFVVNCYTTRSYHNMCIRELKGCTDRVLSETVHEVSAGEDVVGKNV